MILSMMHPASRCLFLLASIISIQCVFAYNAGSCCELAKSRSAFIGDVPPRKDQQCTQTYSSDFPAATPLYVSYRFCRAECPGIGLSEWNQPSQWVAPLVQFILPSIIFSMTIPRRKKIEFDFLLDFRLSTKMSTRYSWFNSIVRWAVYLSLFVFIIIPVTVDTLIWIFVIMVRAGNMTVAGLLEAQLDFRIVTYCTNQPNTSESDLEAKRELLTTVVSGNLQLEKHGNPQQQIPKSLLLGGDEHIDGLEKSKSRLLNLLEAQASFGGAVGSPVLFFLGSFIYTILDLEQNRSSEDSAISLALGIAWITIVNVAIVSGCLLASNNPSTSSGIVGAAHDALVSHPKLRRAVTVNAMLPPGYTQNDHPNDRKLKRWMHYLLGWGDAYETEFQPVSLWSRGTNKMAWIKKAEAYKDPDFRNIVKITPSSWFFMILMPAFFLAVSPSILGAVVAFYWPPRGLGCRCLSLLIYGMCQAFVCAISVFQNASQDRWGPKTRLIVRIVYMFLGLISFVFVIGGTTFQVVGVFRNCICALTADNWSNTWQKNPSLNLASDIEAARHGSYYWIWMGGAATFFVGFVTYAAWWYQKIVRHRFTQAVKKMQLPESSPSSTTATLATGTSRQAGSAMHAWPVSGRGNDATEPASKQPANVSSRLNPSRSSSRTSYSRQSSAMYDSSIAWDSDKNEEAMDVSQSGQYLSSRQPRPRADS